MAQRSKSQADWWARIAAGVSLLFSGCQALNSHAALEDEREAAVKIETGYLRGTVHKPYVFMRISNVTNKPIRGATIGAQFTVLDPGDVRQIFDNMSYRTEDIQAQGYEPQRLETPALLTDQGIAGLLSGRLVLVNAIKARWTAPGAWFSTSTSRCFAWIGQPARQIACEDLEQMTPEEARQHVQQVLASPPPTANEAEMIPPASH